MPNIRPVSDLRNYAEVLKEISVDEPVFLTKNGRGRYAIVDMEEYEKTKAIIPVDVEFYITDKYLIFKHSGEYFNPKNIAAICDINDGEKSDNIEAIGYKGIGFKTVFLDNDYVYLRTGNYSFRFENDPQYPIYTPWQILPVWTERNELDSDIPRIFNRTEYNEFRVKFALRPRDSKILTDLSRSDNYVNLFLNLLFRIFGTTLN